MTTERRCERCDGLLSVDPYFIVRMTDWGSAVLEVCEECHNSLGPEDLDGFMKAFYRWMNS